MRKICVVAPLLLLLLPSVLLGSPVTTRWTIHYRRLMTWREAQTFCRQRHTDLVTIRDEEENLHFKLSYGWIGLYREDSQSEWKWSRGDEVANFSVWERRNPADNENCVFKKLDDVKWRSHPCQTTHSFLCFDEELVLVKEKKTWEEALNHCKSLEAVDQSNSANASMNQTYTLPTLVTPEDLILAREKALGATTSEVWTGLRFLAGQWVWVGGEEVQYDDINDCPTLRFCGVLVINGTSSFETRRCNEKKNFLCHKKG